MSHSLVGAMVRAVWDSVRDVLVKTAGVLIFLILARELQLIAGRSRTEDMVIRAAKA